MTPYDIKILNEIKAFLDENKVPYDTEYDNFCLNFGTDRSFEIEYVNSMDHPVEQKRYGLPGIPSDYFYKLSKRAEEQNSFKFWVKDFEWNDPNKKEILKSYMLHAAGMTPNRVYARDTEVKIFQNKDIREFQIKNCFYGYRSASLSLGLVLKKKVGDLEKGTLLMITTFGKNFFGKKNDLVEVFRVGTLRNTQVIGGSSKLFKHFIKNHPYLEIGGKEVPYSKVIYYVDYDHGAGKSLDRIGFTFVRDSGGGFMNVDVNTGLVSHRDPMNHKEVMKKVASGDIIAVPNAGVKVYEYVVENVHVPSSLENFE